MRIFRKKGKYILLAILLVLLSGCTRVVDSSGKVLAEKIIYVTTTFKEIIADGSWFTAIFVYPLAQVINILTPYIGVVMAIVVCTVLVNLITLPLTAKSTAGTQKMQMIQPELDKLNKKFEGKTDERSKMVQAQEMQALYKKYDINPLSTILGTFVTLPIIFAMWQAVQRSYAVATGTFMGVDLQVSPLSGWKLGGTDVIIYVSFFVLMGVAQFISISMPKWLAKKKNTEEHKIKEYDKPAKSGANTNIMMYSMLVLILYMGLTWPTAMSVYWLVNSVVNIIKTLYAQKSINKSVN